MARASIGRRPLFACIVLAALALLSAAAVGVAIYALQGEGIAPRALAPYIARRASGHNAVIVGVGDTLSSLLTTLDRGRERLPASPLLKIGAQAHSPAAAQGRLRLVSSSDEARRAFADAQPGDVITFLPGRYRFERAPLVLTRAGSAQAGITVRAEQPGSVVLEMDLTEGFQVEAPYWTLENLHLVGACATAAACEHALHITGDAHHFTARNNLITDFNAHIKINGYRGRFPDDGVLESNTLTNARARETINPVTSIDLVAASRWVIRANLITDFIKAWGDGISYGGFAKGAGEANVFERNVVLCEDKLRGYAGQRVGLSLGGGATGPQYCRDGRCITEQQGGILRANLIANCSDDGIYLNSAAASQVLHNTLIDTGGVQVRFAASSAVIEGNLIDGAIRARNGGVVRAADNLDTSIAKLYLGRHPVRALFRDAGALDLAWSEEPPRRGAAKVPDLCTGARAGGQIAYGAFEAFSACLAGR
ncbi:MAG: right-handed parallel beta-helix repeat-containing protein [Gammaproteobacteria bacterium]